MLSMDFKKIEVYKLYRLISCLDFKKVSMNGANWIVQIVSIDVVFELQRIVQIVALSFYVTKTVMVGPNGFGLTKLIWTWP